MSDNKKQLMSTVETMLISLFRLIPLIALHNPNNTLVISTLASFKESFSKVAEDFNKFSLYIYRGRFFFNDDRMVVSESLSAIGMKMIDFLQIRQIHGFHFYKRGEMQDEDIIYLAQQLNIANQFKDPLNDFKLKLTEKNIHWIEPQSEEDFKKPGREHFNEITEMTYTQAMVAVAKKSYGRALASLKDIGLSISSGKRITVQKPKRIIQEMIEMLTKDDSILLAMSTIRDFDDYTYTHSVNVAILSMCLGRRLGLPRSLIEQLGLCGLFHDLGKIELPAGLINKREELTENEFEIIKEHSFNSVRQIIRLNADRKLKSKLLLAPFEHHLGVNLSGYPRTGRQAPLSLLGRIITIADVYDGMTSGRTYRPEGIKPDQALKMMVEEAGTKLDPLILKTFVDMIGIYPLGSLVVLSSKEIGLVVESPEACEIGRPKVSLLHLDENGEAIAGKTVELCERDPENNAYLRSVVRCLNPSDYGIQAVSLMG